MGEEERSGKRRIEVREEGEEKDKKRRSQDT